MTLFEDEHVLTSTSDNTVTLTTHRIRSVIDHSWGQESITSIMLEKVSSIQVNFTSYPMLLIVAGLCLLGALLAQNQYRLNGIAPAFILIAIILTVIYFLTRKHICIITSDGGSKIIFATEGMKKEALIKFIDKVERAKREKSVKMIS